MLFITIKHGIKQNMFFEYIYNYTFVNKKICTPNFLMQPTPLKSIELVDYITLSLKFLNKLTERQKKKEKRKLKQTSIDRNEIEKR